MEYASAANSTAAEFTRRKIREIVKDPETAEALCPYQHIGTKRTCVDIGYFDTYNRDNDCGKNWKKDCGEHRKPRRDYDDCRPSYRLHRCG